MTVMHDFHEDRTDKPVAGAFYRHVYGGIARDIYVSREAFQRFFELTDAEMNVAAYFAGKSADVLEDEHELVGYIYKSWPAPGQWMYRITIIDRTQKARYAFLRREVDRICESWNTTMKEVSGGFTSFARALSGS